MAKIYVGGVDKLATEQQVSDEFRRFGVVKAVWVARKPPGFAFVEFESYRDAEDAIRELDGKNGWRVEMSRKSGGANGVNGYGSRGPRRDYSPRGRGEYDRGYGGRDRRENGRGYDRGGYDRYDRRRSLSPRRNRSPIGRRSLSPVGRARRSPSYN